MIDIKTVSQCISFDYCKGWNDAVKSIGRCGECKNAPFLSSRIKGMRWCRKFRSDVNSNDYCSYFEPKEHEENDIG